jgi:hypothetical protein
MLDAPIVNMTVTKKHLQSLRRTVNNCILYIWQNYIFRVYLLLLDIDTSYLSLVAKNAMWGVIWYFQETK